MLARLLAAEPADAPVAAAAKAGGVWTAALPVYSTEKPLWVYANVVYPLAEPVTGAGYYYRSYTATKFSLSSLVHLVSPGELRAAGVEAVPERSRMIETFEGGWEKEWFTYRPVEWARTTHKVYDPRWVHPNRLVMIIYESAAQPPQICHSITAASYSFSFSLSWKPKGFA